MKPLGITAYRVAKDIGVPVTRIQAIIAEEHHGVRGIRRCAGAIFRHLAGVLAQYAARL